MGINAATLAVVLHRYWWRHLRKYDPVRVALEFERKHPELNSLLVKHTGQAPDKVIRDTDRDYYMSAEEAKAYGIVDEVMVSRS